MFAEKNMANHIEKLSDESQSHSDEGHGSRAKKKVTPFDGKDVIKICRNISTRDPDYS